MKKVISLLTIYCCLSAIYCNAQGNSSIESDKGVKEITLSPFETVVAKGGGNIYFHYSPNTKVEIKGAGSCVEKFIVEVSSNTLSINPKNGFSENCRSEIHIFTPMVKEIQQDGGGSIKIKEGFASVDVFKCSINGGGNVKMTALRVDSLFASIDEGGEISAQVNKILHGKISGGGVIYYQGDPTVESFISGGGAIKQK
jgi:hypothetical protein